LPPGSLVNPSPPAAVNARSATIKRITCSMLSALADAAPDRVPAPNAGELLVMAFGGQRKDGTPFVTGELLSGGSGAGNGFDGVDAIETDATNCMNLPAEAMELEAPIRINRWCLKPDSGGPGTWRGGLGQIKEFEVLKDVEGTLSFSHRGERHFVPAPGMRGGGAGACARSWIARRDGTTEVIPSKVVTHLAPGDRLVIETAGAGGYGDPAQRSKEAVKGDIADGKVSPAAGEPPLPKP
jgi:N-methylhydantoinase B